MSHQLCDSDRASQHVNPVHSWVPPPTSSYLHTLYNERTTRGGDRIHRIVTSGREFALYFDGRKRTVKLKGAEVAINDANVVLVEIEGDCSLTREV